MTAQTPQDAPESPETGEVWLSVSAAAAACGVSEKTIWRRAKAGEITARKVAGARGGLVWKIALDSTGQPTGQTEIGTDKRDSQPDNRNGQKSAGTDTSPVIHAQTDRTNRNAQPDTGTDKSDRPTGQPSGHGDEMAARLLAQLEREIERLERDREAWRKQAEEASRQAATATAALREYIKAQPRQLTSGAQLEQVGTAAQTTPEAPISSANQPGGQRVAAASDEAQNGEVSSYGALADWLENEILER